MNWELHGSFLAWAYDGLVVGGQLTTSDQPDRLLPFFFFTISAFDILHLCGCYKSLPHRRSITLLLTFMRLRVYAKSEISKFKADNCGHHRGRINPPFNAPRRPHMEAQSAAGYCSKPLRSIQQHTRSNKLFFHFWDASKGKSI